MAYDSRRRWSECRLLTAARLEGLVSDAHALVRRSTLRADERRLSSAPQETEHQEKPAWKRGWRTVPGVVEVSAVPTTAERHAGPASEKMSAHFCGVT